MEVNNEIVQFFKNSKNNISADIQAQNSNYKLLYLKEIFKSYIKTKHTYIII